MAVFGYLLRVRLRRRGRTIAARAIVVGFILPWPQPLELA